MLFQKSGQILESPASSSSLQVSHIAQLRYFGYLNGAEREREGW